MEILKKLYHQLFPQAFRIYFAFLRNPKRFALLANPQYNDDGIITSHIPTFLYDEKFQSAYEKGKNTGALAGLGFNISWRAHTATWAAAHGLNLRGDFVECGVARGLLSKTICEYLEFNKIKERTFYLIDTFEGIPKDLLSEKEQNRLSVSKMDTIYNNFERAQKNFEEYSKVKIVKGEVPNILYTLPIKEVAYLSIDMNSSYAERAALEFFWPKMVHGAVIVFDDYAYSEDYLEQRVTINDFAKQNQIPILTLPTGQGVMIKNC